jgi:hypothetical protein
MEGLAYNSPILNRHVPNLTCGVQLIFARNFHGANAIEQVLSSWC